MSESIRALTVVDPLINDLGVPARNVLLKTEEEAFRSRTDLAVIAASTPNHFRLASRLLSDGVPTLVEKPMASNVPDCEELARLSDSLGIPFFVGHVERFNPTVQLASRITKEASFGRLVGLKTVRSGPAPRRAKDVSIGLDLGTHDFDLCRLITGEEYETLNSRYVRDETGEEMMIKAQTAGGIKIQNFLERRRSQSKTRSLRLLFESISIELDLISHTTQGFASSGELKHVGRVLKGYSDLHRREVQTVVEPLKAQFKAFCGAVFESDHTAESRLLADASDGREAVKIAEWAASSTGSSQDFSSS